MPDSLSISIRVKRTTIEYSYIKVPVATNVMQTTETGDLLKDENGYKRVDGKKVFDEALRLARSSSHTWYPEDQRIEAHPVQKAPDPDEQ
jgi:hypothetical protein